MIYCRLKNKYHLQYICVLSSIPCVLPCELHYLHELKIYQILSAVLLLRATSGLENYKYTPHLYKHYNSQQTVQTHVVMLIKYRLFIVSAVYGVPEQKTAITYFHT